MQGLSQLTADITACQSCADRFGRTATGHRPRPVVWLSDSAKILIAGQAPGAKVHASGRPFTDPSGDRLRAWMGVDADTFYDRSRIAILPMAFCFPGYSDKGADLPPPRQCADQWRAQALAAMPQVRLTLLVGGYAQKWHLNTRDSVTQTVSDWRSFGAEIIPLPHPSWRNTSWLKRNPWFEADLLPDLQARIAALI